MTAEPEYEPLCILQANTPPDYLRHQRWRRLIGRLKRRPEVRISPLAYVDGRTVAWLVEVRSTESQAVREELADAEAHLEG